MERRKKATTSRERSGRASAALGMRGVVGVEGGEGAAPRARVLRAGSAGGKTGVDSFTSWTRCGRPLKSQVMNSVVMEPIIAARVYSTGTYRAEAAAYKYTA